MNSVTKMHEQWMRQAIKLAEDAKKAGNDPFGAILVKNGEVVMTATNQIRTATDPTHHPEIVLVRDYCRQEGVTDLRDVTMYTSCEPCVMCSGAIVWSNLGRLVYSVSHEQLLGMTGSHIQLSSADVFRHSPSAPEVIPQVCNEAGLRLFSR